MESQTSTKPYLIRAIHEWCSDNGYTPYLVVAVRDKHTRVPEEFVKNDEIVLNVGFEATKNLMLKNEYISFMARFGGVSREVMVPIGAVLSIFARETGDGMGFEYEAPTGTAYHESENVISLTPVDGGTNAVHTSSDYDRDPDPDKPQPPSGRRPNLKIVK